MTPTVVARDGWIDLQLSLVEMLAEREGMDYAQCLTQFTSLRRRLGLVNDALGWSELCRSVAENSPLTARQIVCEMAGRRFMMGPPAGVTLFGCFHYNAPNENGEVRIHFAADNHSKGVCGSPLAIEHLATRKQELVAMFTHMRRSYPHARTLVGSSWLYNLQAYKRLFPPAYGASVQIRKPLPRLIGLSSWGQFFTHDGHLKSELVDVYKTRLAVIRLPDLWQLMPLPVMTAMAPLQVMYRYYSAA